MSYFNETDVPNLGRKARRNGVNQHENDTTDQSALPDLDYLKQQLQNIAEQLFDECHSGQDSKEAVRNALVGFNRLRWI